MTDLIARLRDAAIDLRDTSFAARTIREAADELERLTPTEDDVTLARSYIVWGG